MKKKFFRTLILLGAIIFLITISLCFLDIISFSSLWVKYLLLLGLLFLFMGLSNFLKKFTDYRESMIALKHVIKTLNKIKNTEIDKINYVHILGIRNQLDNAVIYIGNMIDNYDLYELRDNLNQLNKIKLNYSVENKSNLTNETIEKDLIYINETIENIKYIKSKNVLIR